MRRSRNWRVSDTGGLDLERLAPWLREHCDLGPITTVVPVLGGRSNLTTIITDDRDQRIVVRRPPLSGVLASAHDVAREGRIMEALGNTSVPVPPVLAIADEQDGLGVPLLVTGFVAGHVIRDVRSAADLDLRTRHRLTPSVVRTLAALHDLDVDAIGLGALARRSGYFMRQVERWTRQLARGGDRAVPVLHELAQALSDRRPAEGQLALVHGDYRLDNLIVDVGSCSVRAVLDWELSTLGDPLADLGTLLVYWGVPPRAGRAASVLLPDLPTAAEGFAEPAELVITYAEARGLDAEHLSEQLRPYLAFAWFRIACILEGVRIRTGRGAYGELQDTAGEEMRRFEELVPELGYRALSMLAGRGPVVFEDELI